MLSCCQWFWYSCFSFWILYRQFFSVLYQEFLKMLLLLLSPLCLQALSVAAIRRIHLQIVWPARALADAATVAYGPGKNSSNARPSAKCDVSHTLRRCLRAAAH